MSNATNNSESLSNISALYKLDDDKLKSAFSELKEARRREKMVGVKSIKRMNRYYRNWFSHNL